MKRLLTFMMVALISSTCAFAQEQKTETKSVPWFDMETCEICKCMSENKDMVQHIKWETHLIPDGFLAVSVIPEKLKATALESKKKMKATIARLENGEEMKCCGYCQGMGELLGAGAKMSEISTIAGEITMLTSTDSSVVKKIHEHAKRTIVEHEKMVKAMSHSHSEHSGEKQDKK